MSVREQASQVLLAIAQYGLSEDDPKRGRHNLTGEGVRLAVSELLGQELSPVEINDAVAILLDHGHVSTRSALGTGPYRFMGVELTARGRVEYEESVERQQRPAPDAVRPAANPPTCGGRVFIGHGGSPVWRIFKDFVQDRLALNWDEFNREATAGLSTKERLEMMLDQATFAFLIMTAEDERADGKRAARANVIHEVGLFQGRLGFQRAIVLLEDGCEEFSNIVGTTQIRFPAGHIEKVFEEVRRVLEREKVLTSSPL